MPERPKHYASFGDPATTAIQTIQTSGPLPVIATFTSAKAGERSLFVSGTAFGTVNDGLIGFAVTVNGAPWLQTEFYISETAHIHHTLPSLLGKIPVVAGSNTIEITALANTTSDSNDRYVITILQ